MTNFSAFVSSWGNMLRTIILLVVFGTLIYFGAKLMNIRGDDITYEGKNITIHLSRNKVLTIVDVPAYQIAVPSGVKLEKHYNIEFYATGLVTCGIMPDCGDLMKANDLNELKRSLISVFNAQAHHLEWRGPDGKLLYIKRAESTSPDCLDKESDKRLVYPKDEIVDYGYLLAFIVPPNCNPQEVLANLDYNTKILKIGKHTILKYENNTFTSDDSPGFVVDSRYIGGEIYFTINDTIIRDENDLSYSTNCIAQLKNCDQTKCEIYEITNTNDKKASKRMLDPKHPYGMWYLDNRGSFTVSLLQNKS